MDGAEIFSRAIKNRKIWEEIKEFAVNNRIISYITLCEYARLYKPEWRHSLYTHPRQTVAFLRHLEYVLKKEGN